jgi:hypothetical protein
MSKTKGNQPCLSTSQRALKMYIMAQRPGGVTSTELIAAWPDLFDTSSGSTTLCWAARTGRVMRVDVREGRVSSRFFADPNLSLRQIETKMMVEWRAKLDARASNRKAHERPQVKLTDPRDSKISPHYRQGLPRNNAFLQKAQGPVVIVTLPSAPVYSRHQHKPGDAVPRVVDPAECRSWAQAVCGD